jgi:hypothetical protein
VEGGGGMATDTRVKVGDLVIWYPMRSRKESFLRVD